MDAVDRFLRFAAECEAMVQIEPRTAKQNILA